MIQCPQCRNSLPDTFTKCQFCGADVTKVPRPVQPKVQRSSYGEPAKWVFLAYYGIAGYWLIGGAMDIFRGVKSLEESGGFAYIGIVFGAITALVAIGLMARIELVRGIVNILSFLRILSGALGLWGALMGSLFIGPLAILFAIFSAIDVASGLFMIYLIGETDKYAPQ